jgi:3-deoxy-manno-octulosonate cytidylyltransferase (CMP-KDO synthetase)
VSIEKQEKLALFIPARYQSTRFPGKPLHLILGKPMIQWMVERLSGLTDHIYVLTDHVEIEQKVLDFGGKVLRVDDDCVSGTERLQLAWKRFFEIDQFDIVMNVQGDEPLIKKETVLDLYRKHRASGWDIASLARQRSGPEVTSANIVKVVTSREQKALYFSRSPLPYQKDYSQASWKQHIGLYSFTPKFLDHFPSLKQGNLEQAENLEQLRWMESGFNIGIQMCEDELIGVDTPEDIALVEQILSGESDE